MWLCKYLVLTSTSYTTEKTFHIPFNKLPLPHPSLLLYLSLHVAIPLQTILGAKRNHVCAGIFVLCIGAIGHACVV